MSNPTRARVLAAGAAALVAAPHAVRAQTAEKIRIGGVPTDDLTPVYYAINAGLYKKAGLDVELVPTSSGTAATQAAVTGTYEMGKGSLIATLLAHLKGLPITMVANGVLWDPKKPLTSILVAADSPLKTAADCNGKTSSAAALNDLGTLSILAWMDKNGGDSRTLKFVEIPNSVAAQALIEHRTDLGTINEPQLIAALETGKTRVIGDIGAVAEHYAITAYFANADWASKHGEAIKRWVKITYEAAAYTNAHKAETAQMMSDITKIPLATYVKMNRPDGATTSDPAFIQGVIDTAARYKYIPERFNAKDAYITG